MDMTPTLWTLVLAAGAGRRLLDVTGGTPKQFWRPAGCPTLLELTLARLAPLVPAERTVIVLNEAHRKYADRLPLKGARLVFQPEDRGTAAGVLIGLLPILAKDPRALVLITPADHGVRSPDAFRAHVRAGVAHVESQDSIVVFGVVPQAAHTDHGWIALDRGAAATGVQPVATFVEKPDADSAERLLASGGLLSTMVLAARARALLHLCCELLPELTPCFIGALTLPREVREARLRASYPQLSAYDFSRDLLARAEGLSAYGLPASVGWSDLGTPDRVVKWLRASSHGSCSQRRPAGEIRGHADDVEKAAKNSGVSVSLATSPMIP
jgi:mannose-1-phosphate guanylyltransferase